MNFVSETHEAGSVLEASVNFSSPFFFTVTKAEMLFGWGEKVNLKFIIGVCVKYQGSFGEFAQRTSQFELCI